MLMCNPNVQFAQERAQRIARLANDADFNELSRQWIERSLSLGYPYNFEWLGRPIIQYPQDIIAFQEVVFRVRPELIIETGIAHGGSLTLSASLLTLLDVMDGRDVRASSRRVIGVDIDIRQHNRDALDAHPLRGKMLLLQGSSVGAEIVTAVRELAATSPAPILVCLDSNHTHEHVLAELRAYSALVTEGSYLIVFDTFVEMLPKGFFKDRPWDRGNSPHSAVQAFLAENDAFEIDEDVHTKLSITASPSGYLRRKQR